MSLTRRNFIAFGAGGVTAALTGCDRSTKEVVADYRRWMGQPEAAMLAGELTAPASPEIDSVSHAISRLTFGTRPGEYARVAKLGVEAFIEEQLAPEKIDDTHCERLIRHEFEELGDPAGTLSQSLLGKKDDPIQQLFPTIMESSSGRVGDLYEFKDKVLLQDLTRARILRAVLSQRQLFEVMVDFWTDHFNIDPSKAECKWLKAADDRAVIRKHALGNFTELLRASALSPAMLWYLDGRVNARRKPSDKPNENYARELMELHTLGVHGGYTQQDVMEVARCLTGWTVRDRKKLRKGSVEFHPGAHDDGPKTVLGQTIPAGLGMRDLDRVLNILVAHPSTARYLARKLCTTFIADEPPAAAIDATAAAFARTGGDIRGTLRALFRTPEFAAAKGTKFKRPFHFVVSALRGLNARTDAGRPVIDALLRMGHAPFRYPTPDGYPEEATHWTSSLLWRWNFALALTQGKMKGTAVRADELAQAVGGETALLATLFGRQPGEAELRACRDSGSALAVALASPAFQRC
jgi:uncharacterized protein (DUF1800 family)